MIRGFTLLELLVVLSLFAVAAGVAYPAFHRQVDRMAVVAAREAVAALLVRTRGEALARGGAELVVQAAPAKAWVEAGGERRAEADLGREFSVTVDLGGAGSEVRLRYDALGIGRMASRTLRFRRGSAEVRLVVSSYGRAVRP